MRTDRTGLPDSGPTDGAGVTGERTDLRSAFIVSPGFSGPVLFDPFGYGPAWGWWGLDPARPGDYVTLPPVPPNMARISLHVKPRKADLVIDGTDIGEARDYTFEDRPLWLSPGPHQVEIRFAGYQTLRLGLELSKGQVYDLHYRLDRGEGIDSRSSGRKGDAPDPSHQRVAS
jgi:hypothetical protein